MVYFKDPRAVMHTDEWGVMLGLIVSILACGAILAGSYASLP
jgi:hypothetical protein